MLWLLQESSYITVGFIRIFTTWFLCDYLGLGGNGAKQPTMQDLLNPKILSKYLGEEVESVMLDTVKPQSKGGGGTGTNRAAITIRFKKNPQDTKHYFVKIPTNTLPECCFLSLFQVYDNEVRFYCDYFPSLPSSTGNYHSVGPEVYLARRLGVGKFLLVIEDVRYRNFLAKASSSSAPITNNNNNNIITTVNNNSNTVQNTDNNDCDGCIMKTTFTLPFSLISCRTTVTMLAQLHAQYWQSPPKDIWQYSSLTGKAHGFQTPPFLKLLAYGGLYSVQRRYGQALTFHADVYEAFQLAISRYDELRRFWSAYDTYGMTMCHGDAHMGNLFFSVDELQGGFLDFQCVSQEHHMRDISYHLINSCPSDLLASIEEEMIKFYLQSLQASLQLAVKEGKKHQVILDHFPNYQEAYFQYRSHAIWSLIAWIICCGCGDVLVMEEFAVKSLQRAIDSCHRLDVLQAVKMSLKLGEMMMK